MIARGMITQYPATRRIGARVIEFWLSRKKPSRMTKKPDAKRILFFLPKGSESVLAITRPFGVGFLRSERAIDFSCWRLETERRKPNDRGRHCQSTSRLDGRARRRSRGLSDEDHLSRRRYPTRDDPEVIDA